MNILLLFTGGTICSFANEKGERSSNVERAQTLIVSKFRESGSAYASEERVSFDIRKPLDILSENMTTTHWNTLIECMREYDYSKYDGVIVMHGTDTLAYTSSLLSILMAGIGVPVIMVSSQLPPYEEKANGNANFRAAVELIANGIKPNVYAVYGNIEPIGRGEEALTMYVHYGAHLLQCANHSDNFYSCDMTEISMENAVFEGMESTAREPVLYTCPKLIDCVLRIMPYVGINYDWFNLEGVKAVMHGTYHSSTMDVDPYEDDPLTNHSILSIMARCSKYEPAIPVFVEPCNKDAYSYATTGKVIRRGAHTLWNTTSEMAYVKLLLGGSMGLAGGQLKEFLDREINHEFIRGEEK